MTDYSTLKPHKLMEDLVINLMNKTQNEDPMFFRLMVSYYFCKLASMMRCNVQIAESQVIPINMYAIDLAPSGSGKGHSVGIIEENVINKFRHDFLEHTFPELAERNLTKIGIKRARKKGEDPDDEVALAQLEFEEQGKLLFGFDSGTPAAVKQMRTKLLLGGAGSMNFEMDEMGSNLLGNTEILTTFLELFDMGRIKQKLIKNTRENVRSEDLFGSTPTNMLLFGTPNKLFDGGKTEDEYNSFLDCGYGRRCFYGFSRKRTTRENQTAQDIYDIYNDQKSITFLATLSDKIGRLADKSQFAQNLRLKKDVSLALFEYRLHCQRQADMMNENHEIAKAELAHRYFKVAKLAGAYAFIDGASYVTLAHLENAIFLAEESGIAFAMMMKRDRPHVKLANYLATIGREMTHSELVEDLAFFKGTEQAKREMINLAIGHGLKNGIVITRDQIDGIELLSAKEVPSTDMQQMIFAASKDITTGYVHHQVPFNKLHNLVTKPKWHWVTHNLKDGYRDSDHVIPGFNLICLDVEKSVSIATAKSLLQDWAYLIHTTKRHTEKENRFRVIMPLSHILELDEDNYREFMRNIYAWLPFEVDAQTSQRARKWLSNEGEFWYSDGGVPLDALQFVPKTKKAEEHKQIIASQSNLSALERWFVNNTQNGNRNNQLIQYAYALIDMGQDLPSIQNNVLALNKKLKPPLDEVEVLSTVIASATRKFHQRSS
jgi:hypothetical protein